MLLHVRPISCVFGCISQFITAALAVTRLCKVCLPFTNIPSRAVYCYLTLHSVYMVAANGTYYVLDALVRPVTMEMRQVMALMEDICFYSYLIHCILGVVSSVITVMWLLIKRRENPVTAEKYLDSCITVMFMNSPYILTICFIGGVQWGSLTFNTREIIFAWMPILTSALDPVILIARKKEMRGKIHGVFVSQGLQSRQQVPTTRFTVPTTSPDNKVYSPDNKSQQQGLQSRQKVPTTSPDNKVYSPDRAKQQQVELREEIFSKSGNMLID